MPIYNLYPSHGALKILSNGDDSKPSYTLSSGVSQQISYTNPKLSSESYYPPSSATRSVADIYDESYFIDVTEYTHIFLEARTLGVTNIYRAQMSYSGKTLNENAALYVVLHNPVSLFTENNLFVLPSGETSHDNIVVDIAVYTDTFSQRAPVGTGIGGYHLSLLTYSNNLVVTVESITRLNPTN